MGVESLEHCLDGLGHYGVGIHVFDVEILDYTVGDTQFGIRGKFLRVCGNSKDGCESED